VQAIGRQPQRAPDGAPVHDERHRAEQTTLCLLVRQNAASFIAHTEASTGAELPRFIKDEFDAFLACGILAHGFLRLRCGECGHDKLLAFSCKRRGFCPSCGARRMSQTAAHLVDHVIPHVPVRQWVLSLPIPLRLLLAAEPELVTPVRRHRRFQPACRRAGRSTRLQAAGAAVPLHHPAGAVRRAGATQRRRPVRGRDRPSRAGTHQLGGGCSGACSISTCSTARTAAPGSSRSLRPSSSDR